MKVLKNEFQSYVESIANAVIAYSNLENKSNNELMNLYFEIGKNIVAEGETGFVIHLSKFLSIAFPQLKGFSPRNLRRMRDFYNTYKSDIKIMEKARLLNWTQNTVIMESCANNSEREFYINLAISENLSKLALIKAIDESLFESSINEDNSEENNEQKFATFCEEKAKWGNYTKNHCKAFCEGFVCVCERVVAHRKRLYFSPHNAVKYRTLWFLNHPKTKSGFKAFVGKIKAYWYRYRFLECKSVCEAFVPTCERIRKYRLMYLTST